MSVCSSPTSLVSKEDLQLLDYLENHPFADNKSVNKECGGTLSRKNGRQETLLHVALRYERAVAAVWLMTHCPKLIRATSEITPHGYIDGSARCYVAAYCPQVTFALPTELLFYGTRFKGNSIREVCDVFPGWQPKEQINYLLEFGVRHLILGTEHLVIKMIREARYDVAQLLIEHGAPVKGALATCEKLKETKKNSQFRDNYLSNPLSKTLVYKYLKQKDEKKFTKYMRLYSGDFNQRVGDKKRELFFVLVLATGTEAMLRAFLERAQLLNQKLQIDPDTAEGKRALKLADKFPEALCTRVKNIITKNKKESVVASLNLEGIQKTAEGKKKTDEDKKFKEKMIEFWFAFTKDDLTEELEEWFRDADGKCVLGVRKEDSEIIERVPGLPDTLKKPKIEGIDFMKFIWLREVYNAWFAIMDKVLKSPTELDDDLKGYMKRVRTKEGLPIVHLLLANFDFAGLMTLRSIMPQGLEEKDGLGNDAITYCKTLTVISTANADVDNNGRASLLGSAKTPREVLDSPVVSLNSSGRLNLSGTHRNSPKLDLSGSVPNSPSLLRSKSQRNPPSLGNSGSVPNSPSLLRSKSQRNSPSVGNNSPGLLRTGSQPNSPSLENTGSQPNSPSLLRSISQRNSPSLGNSGSQPNFPGLLRSISQPHSPRSIRSISQPNSPSLLRSESQRNSSVVRGLARALSKKKLSSSQERLTLEEAFSFFPTWKTEKQKDFLLQNGMDSMIRNDQTLLNFLIENCHWRVAELVVRAGAEVSKHDLSTFEKHQVENADYVSLAKVLAAPLENCKLVEHYRADNKEKVLQYLKIFRGNLSAKIGDVPLYLLLLRYKDKQMADCLTMRLIRLDRMIPLVRGSKEDQEASHLMDILSPTMKIRRDYGSSTSSSSHSINSPRSKKHTSSSSSQSEKSSKSYKKKSSKSHKEKAPETPTERYWSFLTNKDLKGLRSFLKEIRLVPPSVTSEEELLINDISWGGEKDPENLRAAASKGWTQACAKWLDTFDYDPAAESAAPFGTALGNMHVWTAWVVLERIKSKISKDLYEIFYSLCMEAFDEEGQTVVHRAVEFLDAKTLIFFMKKDPEVFNRIKNKAQQTPIEYSRSLSIQGEKIRSSSK